MTRLSEEEVVAIEQSAQAMRDVLDRADEMRLLIAEMSKTVVMGECRHPKEWRREVKRRRSGVFGLLRPTQVERRCGVCGRDV